MLAPVSAASASDQIRTDPAPSDAVVLRPPVHRKPSTALPSTGGDARRDGGNVVDVAFVYPASLVAQADVGGIAGLRTKFDAAIAGANEAFSNSGIPVQLRNVGDRQVAAATTTNLRTMLKQVATPGDGVYDEAQALRAETHADLVSLWAGGSVPLGDACGVGSLGGLQPTYDADYSAWTVLFYSDCIDKFRVFEHEIGHNFSGDHDNGAASPPMEGKPYARGYTDAAHGFITVMAYYDACRAAQATCTRMPYFSSPTLTTPQGYATGTAGTDNTRAVTEQAPIVANYRQSQIYPATPTISGEQTHRKTLSVDTTGWSPSNVSFTHQWTADGLPIPGATSATLPLDSTLVGKSIAVTVTGAAAYYQPVSAMSAATGPIGRSLFDRTSRPRIKGVARPRRALHASVKSWQPGVKMSYRFTWLRNGKKIKHATGRTYRVTRKDRGKKISVKVTGRSPGFESQTRRSRKVKVRR